MKDKYNINYAQIDEQSILSVESPKGRYGFALCPNSGYFMLSEEQASTFDKVMSKGEIKEIPVKDNTLVDKLINVAEVTGPLTHSPVMDEAIDVLLDED